MSKTKVGVRNMVYNVMIFVLGVVFGGFILTAVSSNEKIDQPEITTILQVSSPSSQLQRSLVSNGKLRLTNPRSRNYTLPAKILYENQLSHELILAESNYESTFRNCLGTNCFDEVVDVKSDNKKLTRVGILAPSLSGADTILKMIRLVGLADSDKIEVVLDTHVPAYGYGKNHGWSRIIRVVRRLVPHAQALVLSSTAPPEHHLALLDKQTRQLMRWNCRLSHVAAHTAMLTIFIDDLLQRPLVELEKMLTFSGFKAARQDLLSAVEALYPQLLKEMQVSTNAYSSGSNTAQSLSSEWQEALAATITNEMLISKELTKWPCRSFRELEGKTEDEVLLGKMLPMRFYDLSANCSDKHVKCSVRFDVDEQKP